MLPPGGGGASSGGVPGGDPPGMATAAGGTHPTGMHSYQTSIHRKFYSPAMAFENNCTTGDFILP